MFKVRLIAQNMALKGTFFRCLIESEKIPFEMFNILCWSKCNASCDKLEQLLRLKICI